MKAHLTIALALVLALLLAACETTTKGLGDGSEDDFGVGGDRAPTVRTLHTMARVLAAQGREDQCEQVLFKLIHEHPEFMPAYVELAELYMRGDRTDDAVEVLTVGVERAPEDIVIHNDLGMALLLRGDYEEALRRFTEASALAPKDARSRSNAGTAMAMLGRYDEALAIYLQVVPLADAYHNVGVLAEARGDAERAANAFAAAALAAAD
jgi:Flp pilus assembly protein TadD